MFLRKRKDLGSNPSSATQLFNKMNDKRVYTRFFILITRKKSDMKRFLLICILMSFALICRAQYYTVQHYIDYEAIASAIGDNEETKMLNNISFDANAFRDNEVVYNRYLDFCKNDELYSKRRDTWDIIAGGGALLALSGLIPLGMALFPKYEANFDKLMGWGLGILSVGAVVCSFGKSSSKCEDDNMKQNKKDMIYYLKVYNNGVGIITTF